jgi:hypothetical protein
MGLVEGHCLISARKDEKESGVTPFTRPLPGHLEAHD